MTRTSLDGDNPRLPILPIQVLRLKPGNACFIRTLNKTYGGCMTHWIKGKTEYCPGTGCRADWHKEKQVWKGYAACEQWDKDQALWIPWVLEITEYLDSDFAGVYDRGQVWELQKAPAKKGDNPPLVGRLIEVLDHRMVPPAFDFMAVLRNLWHVPQVKLDVKNPNQVRIAMPASQGAPPAPLTANNDRPLTGEEYAAVRQKLIAAKLIKPKTMPEKPHGENGKA